MEVSTIEDMVKISNGHKNCQQVGVPKQTIGIRGTVVRIQTIKVLELQFHLS